MLTARGPRPHADVVDAAVDADTAATLLVDADTAATLVVSTVGAALAATAAVSSATANRGQARSYSVVDPAALQAPRDAR